MTHAKNAESEQSDVKMYATSSMQDSITSHFFRAHSSGQRLIVGSLDLVDVPLALQEP